MYQEFIAEADAKGPKFKVKAFIGDAEDFGSLKRNGYSFLGGGEQRNQHLCKT